MTSLRDGSGRRQFTTGQTLATNSRSEAEPFRGARFQGKLRCGDRSCGREAQIEISPNFRLKDWQILPPPNGKRHFLRSKPVMLFYKTIDFQRFVRVVSALLNGA